MYATEFCLEVGYEETNLPDHEDGGVPRPRLFTLSTTNGISRSGTVYEPSLVRFVLQPLSTQPDLPDASSAASRTAAALAVRRCRGVGAPCLLLAGARLLGLRSERSNRRHATAYVNLWRCLRARRPTVTVAAAESAAPHALVTLTQKMVVAIRGGVVNVLASAPTGAEVSPALPWYHW